jgi:hypothetical protein
MHCECVPLLRFAQAVSEQLDLQYLDVQMMSSEACLEDAKADEVLPLPHKKLKKDQPAVAAEQVAADVGPAEESSQDEVKPTLELQGRCNFMEQWKMRGQGKTEESAKEPGADAKQDDAISEHSDKSMSSCPSWLLRVSEPDPSEGTTPSENEDNDEEAKANDKGKAEEKAKDAEADKLGPQAPSSPSSDSSSATLQPAPGAFHEMKLAPQEAAGNACT